ncbi:MAG TPA: FkbM family methyltransferase [Bacteroidia bacterium]|nr:FkbM family methyltransferase [Bacteroidia bacterium]
MSFQKLRVSLIKKLVDLNERMFFERKLLRFYRQELSACNVVIDVGANKGQSIDFFLKLNPKCHIYALEPNPDLFRKLTAKYSGKENIHLFNLGISNRSGDKLFFENIFDYTSTFEDLNPDSEYLRKKARVLGVKPENIITRQYPVTVLTLTDFILTHVTDTHIDILKIDTEGHEYYCLEGLFNEIKKPGIDYIQIENHNDDMYKDRVSYEVIKKLMHINNYNEFEIVPHALGDFDEVVYKHTKPSSGN